MAAAWAPAPKTPDKTAPAVKAGKPAAAGIPANSPLLQPSQTLSGPDLANAATQIANTQTQGPLTELAKQIAQNNTQGAAAQKQTFGYYMALAQQARDAVEQEKGNAAGLNSTLQGIDAGTQQQLAGFGAQAQQGALGRLNALGLGGDSSTQLAGETARLQGLGALNGQAFRDAGASQGSNYTANAVNNLGTFNLRGQERLGDIGRATQLANAPLSSKQAALIASKGALAATALGQLRSQERNYGIAQAGLGLKGSALKTTALNDAAKNALTAAGIQSANQRSANSIAAQNNRAAASLQEQINRDHESAALKQAALNLKQRTGSAKPLPVTQNNRTLGALYKLVAAIPTMQKQGIQDSKGKILIAKPTEAQIRAALGGVDPTAGVLTQAAYELDGWGLITHQTAAQLHQMGIRGGYFRGKPIVVGNPPAQKKGVLGGSLFGVPV